MEQNIRKQALNQIFGNLQKVVTEIIKPVKVDREKMLQVNFETIILGIL